MLLPLWSLLVVAVLMLVVLMVFLLVVFVCLSQSLGCQFVYQWRSCLLVGWLVRVVVVILPLAVLVSSMDTH